MRLFKSRIMSVICWCSPLRFLSFKRTEREMPIFGPGDGVVVEDLQEENRFFAVAQRKLAEIPFKLIAQDEPFVVVFLQTDLVFAVADFGDEIDLGDAEIVARAVFQIQ